MRQFKLDNFRRSFPSREFPEFETLGEGACAELRGRLVARLGLPSKGSDSQSLLAAVHALPGEKLGQVAEGSNPELRALLNSKGIELSTPHRVWVNWRRFEEVDVMGLDALEEHFDDIWYPGPDDIEVFDASLRWFLSVAHDGWMTLFRA